MIFKLKKIAKFIYIREHNLRHRNFQSLTQIPRCEIFYEFDLKPEYLYRISTFVKQMKVFSNYNFELDQMKAPTFAVFVNCFFN